MTYRERFHGIESVNTAPYCAICGRFVGYGIDKHHIDQKGIGGRGKKADDGATITLCGFGNNDGCHGAAHGYRLHFDVRDGELVYIMLDEPTKRDKAIKMDGWEAVRRDIDYDFIF